MENAITSAPAQALAPADTVTLLRDGAQAFPAMLAAIEGARREVVLEMYWLDDSRIARRFIAALAARAREGVAVRVMYDAFGSIGSDATRFDPLVAAGGTVVEYNPLAPWRRRFRLGWVSQRDHRKILVVDGRTGFIGGLNIGTPWMPHDDGGGGWRDDVAMIAGPAAARLRALFYDTWCTQGGERPPELAPRSSLELLQVARDELAKAPAEEVSVLGHDAWTARMVIRRAYLDRVRKAKRRVLIANSYFVPDGVVRRSLERAALRGVEVRVMLPRQSDVPAVAWASRHLYGRMMRAGIHVHEWTRGILHAKTALVDDWATTGSYNFDFRSWRYNLEANVATEAPDFVAAVERSMRADLADGSEEIDPARWAQSPWPDKLRAWAWYLFRKLL